MTEVRTPPRWARRVGVLLAHGVWNTRVHGAEHVPADGPVVVVANHTGLMDGPVLVGAVPRATAVLVRRGMFVGPLGWLLRGSGQIPVDEADGGRSALAAARTSLRAGGVVAVFPEGSRGKGDAADARAGAAWLALNGGALVIPAAVLGTRRTGESVHRPPGLRRRLWIEFGAPVRIERSAGVSGREALVAANEQIRVALAAVVGDAVARSGITLPTDDPLADRRGRIAR
ncbi:MAG: 1-acyl-sn-glycerol-3-phosphate acyltransferase [Actinomycetales bacterium]|nr:1-acyl-sn-glycerol-3-phosphate acyltransferase [Actinomycetales bacterium]